MNPLGGQRMGLPVVCGALTEPGRLTDPWTAGIRTLGILPALPCRVGTRSQYRTRTTNPRREDAGKMPAVPQKARSLQLLLHPRRRIKNRDLA